MKSATPDLIAWLAANRTCFRADLLTIELHNGVTVRWTTAPSSVTLDGHTWLPQGGATSALYKRSNLTQTCGLQVDTLDITLIGPMWVDESGFNRTASGTLLGAAAIVGYFDNAKVTIDHLVMAEPGNLTKGKIDGVFVGKVSSANPSGTNIVLSCKSFLAELQQVLPKFILQPQCGNQVYDYNCTLVKSSYVTSGTLSADQTDRRIITSTTAAIIEKANGYYGMGVMTFASTGESVAIGSPGFAVSGGVATFALNAPTLFEYDSGESFTVVPGCDKSYIRCQFFSNTAHFRGFRRVPKPEASSI
jgi:uncharacterized phage protein (TIGR02218 family)